MTPPLLPTTADLEDCLLADRPSLRRRLRGLRQRLERGLPSSEGLARLWRDIGASRAILEGRRALVPEIQFPPELPVSEHWREVAALIARHQVVILCGETGSGKSTQLPKICLTLGRGLTGRIGHTQLRRIAARTLASRVAQELGGESGGLVQRRQNLINNIRGAR